MKLRNPAKAQRSREQGSAVIVVLVLLAIIIVYACGNARTLGALKRQLVLIEMRQTNAVPQVLPGAPPRIAQPLISPPGALMLHE